MEEKKAQALDATSYNEQNQERTHTREPSKTRAKRVHIKKSYTNNDTKDSSTSQTLSKITNTRKLYGFQYKT